MLASGNAGWIEGAIPISEIIHHSVRRTSSSIYVPTRTVFETCVMTYFFHVFFSSSISLINHQPSRFSRLRFSMSNRDSYDSLFKKSTNTLPGLLDFALRSKRLRIMERIDGRSRSIPSLFTIPSFHPYSRITTLRSFPAGPKTSPFQSHSTLLRFSSRLRSR